MEPFSKKKATSKSKPKSLIELKFPLIKLQPIDNLNIFPEKSWRVVIKFHNF